MDDELYSNNLVHIGARISAELKRDLTLQAQELGISLSDLIHQILIKGFEDYQDESEWQAAIESQDNLIKQLMDSKRTELAKLTADNEEKLKQYQQEVVQRLERLVKYVDDNYGLWTSKSSREQMKKIFNQPIE